jgi:secreted PhoX family phosphatase
METTYRMIFFKQGTHAADHRRNVILAQGRGNRWHEFDERFDAGKHPNEPHRHGWIVEIDPFEPQAKPVKHTALGRFGHEGACHAVGRDGRVTVCTRSTTASSNLRHIIRWREDGGEPSALTFQWDIFVLAGDSLSTEAAKRGNITGDAFGSPDGLWFDDGGFLWIQTDVSTSAMHQGDYQFMGNNQMLAADINTGEIRRFLTGASGCEITDGRWSF